MPQMSKGKCLDIDIKFLGIASLSLEGSDVMLIDMIRGHDDGFPSHGLYSTYIHHKIAPYQITACLLLYYPMQLDQGRIVELVQLTYTASCTRDIQEAYRVLTDNIFVNYPKSFGQLQEILVQGKNRLDGNCLTAVANLIKICGQKVLESLALLNKTEDDVVNKHKKLLHAIQHIFDNKEIPSTLKLPVGDLYVELFIFFNPENFQRLVSKSKFYFNTKEEFMALGLVESYIHRKTPLKYRFPYCEQTINIVIDNLIKKTDQIILEGELTKLSYEIVNKFMEVLLELWGMMTFEKFQTVFTAILLSNNFMKMTSNLYHPLFNHAWKAELLGIYNIITFSVGRCNLFQKFGAVMEGIKNTAVQVFQELFSGQLAQQPEKNQTAVAAFLSSVIQYKLVEFKVPIFDLFTKLIYPNCLLIEKYLQKSANNLPEILNFLDDLSFHLQSESKEVARHKIFLQLCKTSEEMALSFKSLLYSFFTNASKFFPELKEIKKELNIGENIQVWQGILSSINPFELLQHILLYTSISVTLFISDFDFMDKIQEMACLNEDFLLRNPNPKIVFYSTLLYKNYMDDIFTRTTSLRFREGIILLSINRDQNNSFIQSFAMEAMKEKVGQRPAYKEFAREIEMYFEKMLESYDEMLVPIMIGIFREYGEFVKKQAAISIIKQTLHIWQNREIHQDRLSQYLQLIKLFLNLPSCSEYFMNLLQQLVRIANENILSIQKHSEQFLDVMKTGLIAIGSLPRAFQDLIIQFDLNVTNTTLMQSLNHFIMYSNHPDFFNWLAVILTKNQLNTYEVLLIHSLIYYGSKYLSEQSITRIIELAYLQRVHHRLVFDYRNGKLNLIFLFLLKYMWKETNHVLLTQDWQGVTNLAKERLLNSQKIGRVDNIGIKPFIEQIYDLIYLQQNIYRWKYDIEMFIILQLDLFKYQLKDKYQFMYANLSFLACTMNIIRALEIIQNHFIENGSDSDDSLHPHSKLEKEYRGVQEILDKFIVPPHLKQVDYFTSYRKTVAALRNEENSCRWMEMLFQASFRDQHKTAFQNVMKMEKNQEGSYRKITKIRRMRQDERQ